MLTHYLNPQSASPTAPVRGISRLRRGRPSGRRAEARLSLRSGVLNRSPNIRRTHTGNGRGAVGLRPPPRHLNPSRLRRQPLIRAGQSQPFGILTPVNFVDSPLLGAFQSPCAPLRSRWRLYIPAAVPKIVNHSCQLQFLKKINEKISRGHMPQVAYGAYLVHLEHFEKPLSVGTLPLRA